MTVPPRKQQRRPGRFVLMAAWAGLALPGTAPAAPEPAPAPAVAPGQAVVSGVVPDEATRSAVLARVRAVYGNDRVVDQLAVGGVVAPPNWSADVQKLLTPTLKSISRGQLTIDGTRVGVRGDVANEAQRQAIPSEFATALNPAYTIRNGLRVGSDQAAIDGVLAGRVIEFEFASALLTDAGRKLLDELLPPLQAAAGRKVEIVGHTDDRGSRAGNLALSRFRAEAVRSYLVSKGLAPERLVATGMGPDQPVADNGSDEGRRRNRRIEFRLGAP